ncbi:hypothetical protein PVM12_14695 [Enterobacter soli]|uniref:hypothetical protein n=1 Tax=Enterobacter soli TaxID=885040 RepID=UPI002379D15B|nr:hypothetical protein [Enterobacter soli]MDD9245282.1 hypothetical protein [Enterobacter soli]
MTIYSIAATSDPQKVQAAIKNHFDEPDYFEVHPGFWFVSSGLATPKELSDLIAPNREIGTFIVVPVTGYYGFHNKVMWDWFSARGI